MYTAKHIERPEYNIGLMVLGAVLVVNTLESLGVPHNIAEAAFFVLLTLGLEWAAWSVRQLRVENGLSTSFMTLLMVLIGVIGLLAALLTV